jgi:hypothetical protein
MKTKLLLLLAFLMVNVVTQAQVTNGLVAKYSFNGGNANDEVGTNHGTVTGATLTADRFGNTGMAYSFDGQGDYIDFTDAPEFQMGTHDFSISLWVNYTLAQQGTIFSKRARRCHFQLQSIQPVCDCKSTVWRRQQKHVVI